MNRRDSRLFAALAATLAWASGCAITLNIPANRFDSPETRGRLGKGHVDPIGLQGSNTLVIVPDVTQSPPRTEPSWDRSDISYRFSGGVGILDRLDLDVKLAYNACGMFQAKYQLAGDPELEAKEGNFSLAATLAYGNSTTSGSASGGFGATGTYTVSFVALDGALIAGKRLSDTVLLYGGPFYTSVSYSGTLDQSGGGGSYELKNTVNQTGVNLGLQIGSQAVFFKLEEAYASASAPKFSQTGLYTGAQLGVRW